MVILGTQGINNILYDIIYVMNSLEFSSIPTVYQKKRTTLYNPCG